jgi:hypothetical protein
MTRLNRIAVGAALVAMLAVPTLISTAGAARHDPPCTVSSASVGLDQSYTVTATGLPSGGSVNLIRTYPNGSTATSPIDVGSDGTFSLTTSSADALSAEQTGVYGYQFVGRVKWPTGSYNQLYSSCSVQVG